MKYGFIIKKNSSFYTSKYDNQWTESIDQAYFFSWSDASIPNIRDLVSDDLVDFSGAEVVKVARKIVIIPKENTSIHGETFRSVQKSFFYSGRKKQQLKIEHHIMFNALKGKSIYSGISISARKETLSKLNNALYRLREASGPESYQRIFGIDFDLYVFNLIKARIEDQLNKRYEEDSFN